MRFLHSFVRLLKKNWVRLFAWEIIFDLAVSLIFLPLIAGLFRLIMKARGYSYLTFENLPHFFLHPIALIPLLLLIILMTFLSMPNIVAVIFILDQSNQNKGVHLNQILYYTGTQMKRILHERSILLSLTVLFLLPFLELGMTSGMITSIAIPEFIMDYIFSSSLYTVLFLTGLAALTFLMLRWIFALHYFVLETKTYKEAIRQSTHLAKKHKLRIFILLITVQLLFLIFTIALLIGGILLMILVNKMLASYKIANVILSAVLWFVFLALLLVVDVLEPLISYAAISSLFYHYKEQSKEAAIPSKSPEGSPHPRAKRWARIVGIVLASLLLAFNMLVVYAVYYSEYTPIATLIRKTEVTAHRGASALYPENTMAAFRGAAELGADWCELDVQQSKDGQIFVAHDTNLFRVTGVDANSYELTYDEIAALDAGSFFSPEYAGEKMPLLREVIQFAKSSQMKLNIELKPSGHETDFEQSVARIIQEEKFVNQCVVTSLHYEVLERMKQVAPKIHTVYVMALAYGEINKLASADGFSVEATSVTENLVKTVHNAGKQLFVWTVNSEENMERVVDLGVDNLITDDVSSALEIARMSRAEKSINELFAVFSNSEGDMKQQ